MVDSLQTRRHKQEEGGLNAANEMRSQKNVAVIGVIDQKLSKCSIIAARRQKLLRFSGDETFKALAIAVEKIVQRKSVFREEVEH